MPITEPCVPLRLTLLGVGAMNSPRYAPAGLLVEYQAHRVMLDGGGAADPGGRLDAWLVTDERSELIREIRCRAHALGVPVRVGSYAVVGLTIEPRPVVHTSHPTYGYLLKARSGTIVWAPEFLEWPQWASHADLMFAEAAGWHRQIRFAHGTGGHAAALDVAAGASRSEVRRLVFAHIGRPTIRALDRGERPPFGEIGHDGQTFVLP
jgi:hypothetical protein